MAKTKSQIPGLAKPRLSPERGNLTSHFRAAGLYRFRDSIKGRPFYNV
jgi:hypothetical protein